MQDAECHLVTTSVKGPCDLPSDGQHHSESKRLFIFFHILSVSHPRAIRLLDPMTLPAVGRQTSVSSITLRMVPTCQQCAVF